MDERTRGRHIPVMVAECLELLRPALSRPGARYLDATTGLGGHLGAVLEAFPGVEALAIDRDEQALALARERVGAAGERCTFVHCTYDEIPRALANRGWSGVEGILMDLGVSSMQLDERERGFSYARDASLDMRMDRSRPTTAADILATATGNELTRILATYGEEKHAARIAEAIVRERALSPITSSARLVAIIREALPQAAMRRGGNPAKRTFQALRIAVNDELDILERALPRVIAALNPGGRVVVEAYHSLEDRLVKRAFREATTPTVPAGVPLREVDRDVGCRLVTRGALQAGEHERQDNPRCASVRVRCLEKQPQDTV